MTTACICQCDSRVTKLFTYNSEDDLTRDGQSPSKRSADIAEPEVEEICNDNTDADEQWFRRDYSATSFSLDKLGLIHGHGRCLYTSTNASDVPRNHDLRNRVRRGLQDCSDDDPGHGEPHALTSAELFAEEEVDDGSCKSAEVVDTDDDAFQRRVGISKRFSPVCICHDPGEDTLIVACVA